MVRDIKYDAFTMFLLATLVFNFPTICHLHTSSHGDWTWLTSTPQSSSKENMRIINFHVLPFLWGGVFRLPLPRSFRPMHKTSMTWHDMIWYGSTLNGEFSQQTLALWVMESDPKWLVILYNIRLVQFLVSPINVSHSQNKVSTQSYQWNSLTCQSLTRQSSTYCKHIPDNICYNWSITEPANGPSLVHLSW